MEADQVKSLVSSAFPDATVSVDLEMGHYTVTVISESFAGMRPVARQQRVYAPLADIIADGAIHAVNIRAMTPAEAG
jgi:acid stress-induced BolA-like protein IbaG/YrbA